MSQTAVEQTALEQLIPKNYRRAWQRKSRRRRGSGRHADPTANTALANIENERKRSRQT